MAFLVIAGAERGDSAGLDLLGVTGQRLGTPEAQVPDVQRRAGWRRPRQRSATHIRSPSVSDSPSPVEPHTNAPRTPAAANVDRLVNIPLSFVKVRSTG